MMIYIVCGGVVRIIAVIYGSPEKDAAAWGGDFWRAIIANIYKFLHLYINK